jgi:predicted phosphodiesterase
MRYALLADIHSNLAAFNAVLSDIKAKGEMTAIWCLGDIVGYGPDPVECIQLLRQQPNACIDGNHDWAAIGRLDISDFNPAAAAAVRWTEHQLGKEEIVYLLSLSLSLQKDNFTLVHGSPREPIWEYLVSSKDAQDNLPHFTTRHCLVGHSHVPLVFECAEGDCHIQKMSADGSLDLSEMGESRLIINPGSVGQPRDGDPRASYMIYDTQADTIWHYRVEYDVQATQRKMLRYGLPESLSRRLSFGQ